MKRLNKKGFTLVELLAVIVVLAIIMVIATQAIGNVIKKNTASSFKSSLDMVAKQAKQAYVMDSGSAKLQDFRALVDYDNTQYEIHFGTGANAAVTSTGNTTPIGTYTHICIVSKAAGKFHNMDTASLTSVFGSAANYKKDTSSLVTSACKKFTN